MMKTLLPMFRRLARLSPAETVQDGELLRRFVQERDQAAFELLVHRHGPMVLGLCRRLIGNVHDAEDAFQATFLTLACRARSIRQGRSIGSWLYKVALRMCQRLRSRQLRLFSRPSDSTEMHRISVAEKGEEAAQRREEALVLANEVDRLSETLRSVVILCYWQGKSSVEAARELGCPPNTVSIRLRRARERLKHQLNRRGVVLSASIAATLGAGSVSAQLSPALAATLSGTAVRLAAGSLAAGMISQPIAFLMKGALLTMWWKPVKLCCLAIVALGALSVPVWQGMSSVQGQQPNSVHSQPPYVITPTPAQPTAESWYELPASGYTPVQTFTADGRLHYNYVPNPGPFEQWIGGTYAPDENLPEDAKKLIADQQAKEDTLRKELEQHLKKQRRELYAKLRQMQDSYTKAGDLDRAVAIRDQARRLELYITDAKPDPGSLGSFRSQVGKSLTFSVIGRRNGSIWGDNGIYTDDSDLGTAAVHAGLLRAGQRGLLNVIILPGMATYGGSTRHGVTSSSYGSFPGSFRLERAPSPTMETPDGANANPFDPDKIEVDRPEVSFKTKSAAPETKPAPGNSPFGEYPSKGASKTPKLEKWRSSDPANSQPSSQAAPTKVPSPYAPTKGATDKPSELPK